MTFVLLALGGVIGALCRYHLSRIVQARSGLAFPLGTLVINTGGSFVLGVLVSLLATHPAWPAAQLQLILGTGFCGAFTTFSSFAWETVELWRDGSRVRAATNLIGQPVLGVLAAWLGVLIGAL